MIEFGSTISHIDLIHTTPVAVRCKQARQDENILTLNGEVIIHLLGNEPIFRSRDIERLVTLVVNNDMSLRSGTIWRFPNISCEPTSSSKKKNSMSSEARDAGGTVVGETDLKSRKELSVAGSGHATGALP
ncbi:hypothetical protein PoB_001924600 [Plakobranchus ocellatus]|uniref:Uncharacterized protein n=1 Tax=Plakobranchus ocellatus TaxID=259542 RepID=A0AAV3ZDM6_9GAST|nr:hypothetical protein PoB_001924600 [Plakobranchus ocellatus]